MSTADNLRAARRLVAQGWVKGTMRARNPDTGVVLYCASGAVFQALGLSDLWAPETPEHRALRDALPPAFNTGRYEDLARYNDDRKTTKADILALYDRAIEVVQA